MDSIETLLTHLQIVPNEFPLHDQSEIYTRHSLLELLSHVNKECYSTDSRYCAFSSSILKFIEFSGSYWVKSFIKNSKCFNAYKEFIRGSYSETLPELLSSDYVEEPVCTEMSKKSTLCFQITQSILKKEDLNNESVVIFLKAVSPDLIFLIFQHIDFHPWTDEQSRKQATDMLNKLFSCLAVSDTNYLLQINLTDLKTFIPCTTIGGQILQNAKKFLTLEKWKSFPHIKEAFGHVLKHIRFPHLSEYLDLVLPPCLLVLDDFQVSNKSLGVNWLLHVIKHVSSEELRWYDRAEVIFEAVKPCLYTHELQLADIMHQLLLAILKVIDKPHVSHTTKYDDIFLIILQSIEFENKIVLRRAYTKLLYLFIDTMGITVVRHTRRLLRTFEIYLETYDGPEEIARLHVLRALHSFIKAAWPRVSIHMDHILKMLIRFVYDISVDETLTSDATKQELLDEATKSLLLMKFSDPQKVVASFSAIKTIETTNVCRTIIDKIILADRPPEC